MNLTNKKGMFIVIPLNKIFIKIAKDSEYGYRGKYELNNSIYLTIVICLPLLMANAQYELVAIIYFIVWYYCLSIVYWNYKCDSR